MKDKNNKYVEEMERRLKIQEEIISNDEFMLWIEKFTRKYPEFAIDDWLYKPEELPEKDGEMLLKLMHFYKGIERYANRNFVYPHKENWGYYYWIEFRGICYKIGMIIGQGNLFYCERDLANEAKNPLKFEDVRDNKKQEKVDEIKKKLDAIYLVVTEAIESEVPKQAIEQILDMTGIWL